jgi:hypothetical protein
VPITTEVAGSIPADGEVYSIQQYILTKTIYTFLLKMFIIPWKKNVSVVVHYGLTYHVIETLIFGTFYVKYYTTTQNEQYLFNHMDW